VPVYISMLRGINVGGHNLVPMERLRALLEACGFHSVQTYIQSGNVVFQAPRNEPVALSRKIEAAVLREFGFPVSVITRTPQDLGRVLQSNPFVKEVKSAPAKVHVAFLADIPPADAAKKLRGMATTAERVCCSGREVYLYFENGMGKAKLTGSVIERVLGLKATARNWNTVSKLNEMALQSGG